MKRLAVLISGLTFVGLLSIGTGCIHGDIRVVKKTQTGGEVALVGPQGEARQKADAYMASTCASGFTVLEEGEQVVGQVSRNSGSADTTKGRNVFGQPASTTTSNSTTTTTDQREWRIKFECKGGGDAPAAPADAAAAPPKSAQAYEVFIVY